MNSRNADAPAVADLCVGNAGFIQAARRMRRASPLMEDLRGLPGAEISAPARRKTLYSAWATDSPSIVSRAKGAPRAVARLHQA